MKKFARQNPNVAWITFDDQFIIRQKSQKINLPLNQDQIDVVEKLMSYVDYSYENQAQKFQIRPGVGMAAIQLGKLYKIAYIHFNDQNECEHQFLFANPEIMEESFKKVYLANGEGCLSVDCQHNGIVPRSWKIKIKALDLLTEKEFILETTGYLAIVFQHEIDHMKGKLFYDRINKFDPYFVNKSWIKI